MLAKWTEILPLFVCRWLAMRQPLLTTVKRDNGEDQDFFIARPDVFFKVKRKGSE